MLVDEDSSEWFQQFVLSQIFLPFYRSLRPFWEVNKAERIKFYYLFINPKNELQHEKGACPKTASQFGGVWLLKSREQTKHMNTKYID